MLDERILGMDDCVFCEMNISFPSDMIIISNLLLVEKSGYCGEPYCDGTLLLVEYWIGACVDCGCVC